VEGGDAAAGADAFATDAPSDAVVATMTVGAVGGTLTTPDGVAIEIPAGALAAETTVTVTRTGPPTQGTVGSTYELGPDGTKFAQAVTLTLPYDPAALGDALPADLMLATRANGDWSSAGFALVDTGSHTVTGYIAHFSSWAIVPSPKGSQCQPDYACFKRCCGSDVPDLCCSGLRNTCYCSHEGPFAGYVACYADCVKTRQGSNFASSPCMSACCRAQAGTSNYGACMVANGAAAAGVLTCARGCTGPGDQMALCQSGSAVPYFEACIWDLKTAGGMSGNIGDACPNQAGVDSQFLYTNLHSVFLQNWGGQVNVDGGTLSHSSLAIQVSCMDGSASGTMNATWNGTSYDGTWTLAGDVGTFTVAPSWPLQP
jgi:hypothetical protein